MARKSSKEYSVFFWWKAKSSSYEFALEDFIFVVGCAANSVGTTLEFAAFRSGPDAKYSRASASWFFLSITMVSAAVRTHFARKNTSIFIFYILLIGSVILLYLFRVWRIGFQNIVASQFSSLQYSLRFFFVCLFFCFVCFVISICDFFR